MDEGEGEVIVKLLVQGQSSVSLNFTLEIIEDSATCEFCHICKCVDCIHYYPVDSG